MYYILRLVHKLAYDCFCIIIVSSTVLGVKIAIPILAGLGGNQASFCFTGLYIITSELYATNVRTFIHNKELVWHNKMEVPFFTYCERLKQLKTIF